MGALDDPALSDQLEALGFVAAADDIQVELAAGTQPFDPLDQGPGIATIGPDDLQPPEEQIEVGEQLGGSIPILDGGGSDANAQDQTEGVHEPMTLAPADLLARIVAHRWATLLGAFDALAVEDGRARRGLASCGDSHLDSQPLVESCPQAALAPGREAIEDRGLGRKVLGQQTSLTPGAVEIEDGVEDGSARVLDGPPSPLGLGHEGLEEVPFVVGKITRIGLGWVHPKLDVKRP
jgi:hypothetical protein